MENIVTKAATVSNSTKPRVIPMVSTKGGEGKSTQSANLAGFLADAGKKTLLIDGDHSQPTASSIFSLEYEAPNGLYELLMKTVDLNHPEEIISRSVIPNLDIVVSNDPHDRLSSAMLHAPDGRMRLKNVLQHPLFNEYDVIIIDSKPPCTVNDNKPIEVDFGDVMTTRIDGSNYRQQVNYTLSCTGGGCLERHETSGAGNGGKF